jgi:hypothetical protein
MRAAPIRDVFTDNGTIRADGRVLYDRYLMQVKSSAESKYPWDYLNGRRENSGHRGVPPAGRGRMHASRALGADVPTPTSNRLVAYGCCPTATYVAAIRSHSLNRLPMPIKHAKRHAHAINQP